ncbi:MAG: hypothetical protein ACT6FE_04020 [Methanosarcinaceae archaeon]
MGMSEMQIWMGAYSTRKLWYNRYVRENNGQIRNTFEAKTFLMRNNNRQDWKYRKTDLEATPHHILSGNFEIIVDSLPITEGKVHFIQQVKEDRIISVLNKDFDAGESVAHEYVWPTIDTKQ